MKPMFQAAPITILFIFLSHQNTCQVTIIHWKNQVKEFVSWFDEPSMLSQDFPKGKNSIGGRTISLEFVLALNNYFISVRGESITFWTKFYILRYIINESN